MRTDFSTMLEQNIKRLEQRLAGQPEDRQALGNLLRLLDHHVPDSPGLGAYSDFERRFAVEQNNAGPMDDILLPGNAAKYYRFWQAIVEAAPLDLNVPVTQAFVGRIHTIKDELAYCNVRLSLFQQSGAISRICHDCYKVQILPLDLVALIQVYFVLRKLVLPRDNTRKCMIEMREAVPYPYKGYILCESEEEAETCHTLFRQLLELHGVTNVVSGLSHGCSEYSIKYPAFKYSDDGSHRDFNGPGEWENIEKQFLSGRQMPRFVREDHNKNRISVRDITIIRTWVDYAQIIGDPSVGQFRDPPVSNIVEPFATRIAGQSDKRKAELAELRKRLER